MLSLVSMPNQNIIDQIGEIVHNIIMCILNNDN
jgi:hypothetical protein